MIGPTGCGKTVLSERLVEARQYVVATGVKHKDESLSKLLKGKWIRISDWKKKPRTAERIVLWPSVSDITQVADVHRRVFLTMLADIYKVGGWCIWTDELRYMTDILGLKKPYVQMYIAARSNNVSLVSAAQRPAHVPLEAYSQASHLFLFRTGDERDLVRMGGLNGVNAKQVAATVAQLPKHHFLHVNLDTGTQTISKVG